MSCLSPNVVSVHANAGSNSKTFSRVFCYFSTSGYAHYIIFLKQSIRIIIIIICIIINVIFIFLLLSSLLNFINCYKWCQIFLLFSVEILKNITIPSLMNFRNFERLSFSFYSSKHHFRETYLRPCH